MREIKPVPLEERCHGKVWENHNIYRCSNRATNNGFCGIHSAEGIAKRRAKRDAVGAEKQAKWNAEFELKEYNRLAGNACRAAGITKEQLESGVGVRLI